MDQVTIVAIAVGVLLVAVVGWYLWQRQRSEALRARYGPEYDRTVREVGDQRRAESELLKRQERVAHLEITPLSASQRSDYVQQWRAVQTRFVDDPKGAVSDADRLVEDVMKARGYPVADFDQRAADLSVHHPRVVENYRAARDIAHRHRRGEATTEDLRQAMVYYRELFHDLLEDHEREDADARAVRQEAGREASRQDRDRLVDRPVERDVRADPDRANDSTRLDDREVRP